MNGRKSGLTARDLRILAFYAKERNRELYWNYLAQIEGENGYGLLAAGVVRHDNMPGKTANLFAQDHAREHNDKVLTEREWDNFGVDLIRQDLALRQRYHDGGQPEKALWLPVKDVQKAHDNSFDNIGVDRNAWTPRQVLEAARQHGGEQEAEDLWRLMRNNGFMGMGRGGRTLTNVVGMENMSVSERSTYLLHMARAYLMSTQDLPHVRPDEIGQEDHSFTRNLDGSWSETLRYNLPFGMSLPATREVTDPDRHRELEDTWHLRLEREAARKRFHP
ncbi:hypothetical protein FHW69_003309, partial [Luteibacter sp. Sphag1AF]|nr:hypothetical protein [Luteibacter sp. Sphag1AF]